MKATNSKPPLCRVSLCRNKKHNNNDTNKTAKRIKSGRIRVRVRFPSIGDGDLLSAVTFSLVPFLFDPREMSSFRQSDKKDPLNSNNWIGLFLLCIRTIEIQSRKCCPRPPRRRHRQQKSKTNLRTYSIKRTPHVGRRDKVKKKKKKVKLCRCGMLYDL